MSIRYLVPEQVVDYIEDHNLYDEDGTNSNSDKGKGRRTGESDGAASSSG